MHLPRVATNKLPRVFDDPFSVGANPPFLLTTASPVAPDGTVSPGSTLTYTVRVSNTSGLTLTSLIISNAVPIDLDLIPDSASDGGSRITDTVRWNIGSLAPGANRALSYAVTIPNDYVSGSQGRYIQSGATLTALEAATTIGQASTVLVIRTAPAIVSIDGPATGGVGAP